MKYKLPTCGFLLLACSVASAQVASHAPTISTMVRPSRPPAGAGKPLVRVNGAVLTDSDLLREEYSIFPYARQHNGAIPKEMEPQIRSGAMKMIIFEELIYQEAQRRKMTVPAAQLQRAEVDFRRQFDTPNEYNAVLQNEFHGSRQLLREKIRRSLLIEAFLKAEVQNKSAVSPVEAKAYYDKNPGRFQYSESFAFQTISIMPPANATPGQLKEGRKRADDALHQAKTTKTEEEFGLLAEKISEDDYRVMMGEHKAAPGDELAPPVLKAMLAMKPGEVSDLIEVDHIYTIVRLKEHIPAGKVKFDDVKAQLQKQMQKEKTEQLRAALDKRLRQNAKIEEL